MRRRRAPLRVVAPQSRIRRLLVATSRANLLQEFIDGLLADHGVELLAATSGAAALAMVREAPPAAVVVDESLPDMDGLRLVAELLRVNAGVHAVVLSDLGAEAFHEAAEGLGIAVRVPAMPTAEDARVVLEKLGRLLPAGG